MTAGRHRGGVVKVPEVTAWFWIAKVLTTALGESVSDDLVHRFNPYLAVFVGLVVFAVAITAQFAARRYITWLYWTTVAMVAIFGTMVADVLHVAMHVPYKVSAPLFAVAVAVILCAWYACERTLSIHSVNTPRRESFYWATVVTTFAFGTATGDLTAAGLHLGYITSALLFTALILVPAVAYRLGLNAVAAFWTAYILTRPIGASFADWLGFPHSVGGEGIGHGRVALVSSMVFVLLIAYLSAAGKDVPASDTPVLAALAALYAGGEQVAEAQHAADLAAFDDR
jgi:uncharacterized membrane-anchored protein